MRTYELMVVFPPDTTVTDEKSAKEAIISLLGAQKATVTHVVYMGKKQLAYPIQKKKEGIYVLATLEGEAIAVGAIEAQVKLQATVLRYLLLVK